MRLFSDGSISLSTGYVAMTEPRLNLNRGSFFLFFPLLRNKKKPQSLLFTAVSGAPQIGLEPITLRLTVEMSNRPKSIIFQRFQRLENRSEPRSEPESDGFRLFFARFRSGHRLQSRKPSGSFSRLYVPSSDDRC